MKIGIASGMGAILGRPLLAVLLVLFAHLAAAADAVYSFAVAPQFEQRKLFAIWRPILDELQRRSGVQLNLATALTVQDFERELERGGFDFVYANPYHVLRVNPKQGYVPLVRDAVPLRGILLVRKDSPVRDPKELDGRKLAVPSPNALGASLLMRADLEHVFGVRMTLVDVKTHSSVYLNVINGLADAGGGVEKTLAEQDAAVRDALRTIYTTRDMPSHPIAAHPRVAQDVRERVRKAVLEMAATPAGKALMDEVPMTQPVATSMEDYLVMRKWRLESYWIGPSP